MQDQLHSLFRDQRLFLPCIPHYSKRNLNLLDFCLFDPYSLLNLSEETIRLHKVLPDAVNGNL